MRLRILQFVCPVGFYGAERWILALANHLDSSRVICHLAVTEESPDQDLQIVDRYPSSIGDTFKLRMRGSFDPSVIISLVKLLRREKIDIIHTHGYKSDLLGAIAARLTGVRTVGTPHGFGASYDWKSRLYKRIGLDALRFFDAVAPLSPDLARQVVNHGVAENKIAIILNGVDLSEVTQVRNSTDSKNDALPLLQGKKIGYIGQIIERKKVGHILHSFDKAWANNQALKLVVVGDGDKRQEMEAIAASLTSARAISFLGFREDRLEILKQLDLFVMTSESEGIPRCLMEAMGMGVPVLAFETAGVDVLISNGSTGSLVSYGDISELANEMIALTTNSERANALAQRARHVVETEFSASRMAEDYTQLFKRISAIK